MSRENVKAVRRSNAAFNAGDRYAFLKVFDLDVEWCDLGHAPDAPESVRGVDAVRPVVEQWDAVFSGFDSDIEEYVEAEDSVVCKTHWRLRGKSSDVVLVLRTAEVYEFKNGKVIRATLGYADMAEALGAVQLRK